MTWFESLTAAFKGGESVNAPLSKPAYALWPTRFDSPEHGADYSYDRAIREGYLTNPIAQRAVRLVTDGIGQIPVQTSDSGLNALVTSQAGGTSVLETLAAHTLLHGNAYVQVLKDGAGKPVELFALRPDRVTIIAGEDGWPTRYEYRVAGKCLSLPLEDGDGWPNVVHVAALHPLDDHYGSGALRTAWQAIAIHNAASRWNRALLENAARPSGALVHEASEGSPLSADQYERLSLELGEAFSGNANAGRPMLLDGGLRWQSLSLSPADMDFATLKSAAARDIALAFGVPPMLLGLPGDNTYANYREANRALWRLTLLQLAGQLLDALRAGLRPWFPRARLAVDLDQIPALSEERERLWRQVAQADFLSNHEKRTMLGIAHNHNEKGRP